MKGLGRRLEAAEHGAPGRGPGQHAMPLEFWTHYWAFTSFVFGAIVGSFLNVCIWRLPRGESLWSPPSHCPQCGARLRFVPDMLPLLSQLWYRSRCRHCGAQYSWRYFWVELLTAVLFTAVYYRYYAWASTPAPEEARLLPTLCAMAFVAALITLFFIDLEHYEIPDVTIAVAVAAAVARDGLLIAQGVRPLWQTLPGTGLSLPLPLSVVGGLAAFWLLWQFAALATAALGREAMGAGDSLLLGAMGAFLVPWPLVPVAFLFAIALGTAGGLVGIWAASRGSGAAASGEAAAPATPNSPIGEEPGAAPSGSPAAPPGPAPESSPAGEAPGAGEGPAAPAERPREVEPPDLPPASRWGRVWTVLGTWLALGAPWAGLALGRQAPVQGLAVAAVGLAAAAWLLVTGIRSWVAGDREWLPAMDEVFEGDPGPRFIPFGPYLVTGTLLAMFVGRPLVEWYLAAQLGMGPEVLAALPWD